MKKLIAWTAILVGLIPVPLMAEFHDPGVILEAHWNHVLNHRKIQTRTGVFDHPAMIETVPGDPSMMIPYAFADSEDIDQDGRADIDMDHPAPIHGVDYELLVVSESASYALLRALWMDDRAVFDRVWKWTKHHLQHKMIDEVLDWDSGTWVDPESLGLERDHLFAWRWVPTADGTRDGIIAGTTNSHGIWVDGWGFASDADQDIALALIFADSRWGSSTGIYNYRREARNILDDLWAKGTVVVDGKRYLNGGTGAGASIEPGYLSPAFYRIFEIFDPFHAWADLVESSYEVFHGAAVATYTGENGGCGAESRLLPDWVMVKPGGVFVNSPMRDEPEMGSDAFRAYWRIALDYRWYEEARAFEILSPGSAVGPHDFLLSALEDNWSPEDGDPTDYDETGKIPRIFRHDGGYLLNESTGAGADAGNSGNRADIATNAVWLSFFSALGNPPVVETLLEPIIRLDTGTPDGRAHYLPGVDGWLRIDENGAYWTIHDHSDWYGAETEYYSNAWGWLGLAQHHGLTVNDFSEANALPRSLSAMDIYTESSPFTPVTTIRNAMNLTVEVRGEDGDPTRRDFIYVRVSSSEAVHTAGCGDILIKCTETGIDTGIYRGSFEIAAFSDDANNRICAGPGSMLEFSAASRSNSLSGTVIVGKLDFGNRTLVDACDDPDTEFQNAFGYFWYPADDRGEPNRNWSTARHSHSEDGAAGTPGSIRFDYELRKAPGMDIDRMFAILGTQLVPEGAPGLDFIDRNWVGMRFWLKGSGHETTVVLKSGNIADWDNPTYRIEATPGSWRQFTLLFRDFRQEGFGVTADLEFAMRSIQDIQFRASSKIDGEVGWFQIDQIELLGHRYLYDACLLTRRSLSLEDYASSWGIAGDISISDTSAAAEGVGATLISANSGAHGHWVGMASGNRWSAIPMDSRNWADWEGVSLQAMVPTDAPAGLGTPRIRLEVRENPDVSEGNGQTRWLPVNVSEKGFRLHIPKTEFHANPDDESPTQWTGNWNHIHGFVIHYGSSDASKTPKPVIIDDVRLYEKNHFPVSEAGADRMAKPGTQVTLDASASSDPDDGIAWCEWTQIGGPPVTIIDPYSLRTSFSVPYPESCEPEAMELVFRARIVDNGGLASEDEVRIEIDSVPDIADAIRGLRILSGISVPWIHPCADMDGDGVFGLPDVVFILRSAAR